MKWVATIAYEVFHSPHWMHKVDERSFCQHLSATYGLHHPNIHWRRLPNCTKIRDFGYTLSRIDMILYCNERHTLLMKCFIIFLRFKRQITGDSESIQKTFMGLAMPFAPDNDCQIAHKIPEFGCHLTTANEMLHCLERQSLLNYVSHGLHYINKSDMRCFWQHLSAIYGSHHPTSTEANSQIARKIPDFGYPFSPQIGCCTGKRDISCSWSV